MLEQAGIPVPSSPLVDGDWLPSPRASSEDHPEQPYPTEPAWAPPGRLERLVIAAWTKPTWLAPLAVLGCIGAACTYVLLNNPTDGRTHALGPCAFKLITGFDCPGCGGTRMVWYLLHGNVLQAARYHVVALLAVPVLAWAYVVWAVHRVTGFRLPSKQVPLPLILGYLLCWIVFAVLRNLPWAPFHWLYVT